MGRRVNNKNQADNTQEKPEAGSAPDAKPQKKVPNKAPNTTPGKTKKSSTGKGWRLFTLFLLLVIITGGGALGWFGQTLWLERTSTTQTLTQQTELIETLQWNIERKSTEQGRLVATFEGKLQALREEQQSQLELLGRSGDASRSKLLLDEAEFLIRLANQRLLVERKPRGAQALLESADQVLVKLDDPGLIALRKTLSQNISELRQTTIIDREGIFLRIETLSDLMMTFPALPAHGLDAGGGSGEEVPAEDGAVVEVIAESWYQNLWQNIRNATQSFVDRHFHVRSLEQPLAPLMTTDKETQLRHSLLTTLGNAQQAVLREETDIYRASLARGVKDIKQYFALNDDTQAIIEQLEALQSEAVQQSLPDISASLYTLRDYRAAADSRFGNGEG